MMKKVILILVMLAGLAWGDTSFIEMTSLPYEISTHTGATWDVYSLSGGVLRSDSFGIWFSSTSANDYVLFDFSGDDGIPGNDDDDSLIIGIDPDWYGFDMGYSTSIGAFGLMTGKYNVQAESLKIRGGYWLSLPTGITCSTDYKIVGAKACNHRMIYSASGGLKNCVFDSIAELTVRGSGIVKTDEFGTGAGSYGISYKGSGVCINGGTFERCEPMRLVHAIIFIPQ